MNSENSPNANLPARRLKRRWWQRVVLLGVISCGLLSMLSFWSQTKPSHLGVHGGQLAPCPDSPNCVSTTAEMESQRMTPLRSSGGEDDWTRLRQIIEKMPRTRIVTLTPEYMHVEFRSLIFRFVDDVEFLRDEKNQQIHFRSASRVGHSDLGVNRRRMTEIQQKW